MFLSKLRFNLLSRKNMINLTFIYTIICEILFYLLKNKHNFLEDSFQNVINLLTFNLSLDFGKKKHGFKLLEN